MADETSEFVDAEAADGWVEGHAHAAHDRGWPSYFKVPLFSQIIGNLWMGGTPADSTNRGCLWKVTPSELGMAGAKQEPRFHAILNVAPFWPYPKPDKTIYREHKMYDSADGLPDLTEWLDLVTWVCERTTEGPTLVHCQAGLNRSSLITAGVLMVGGDLSADDAIELIRQKRCKLCLCNESFENFLRGVAL